MWLSNDDEGQAFLFQQMDPPEPEEEEPAPIRKREMHRDYIPPMTPPKPKPQQPVYPSGALGEKMESFLSKCMEVVEKDPEVAYNGKAVEWESWFTHPILSQIRRSCLPVTAKQRLLSFSALMLPFLDEKEEERVRVILAEMAPTVHDEHYEMLTEQDLIHSQWLVRSVLRSRDILVQMQGLKRSILRSLPVHQLD
ncbi:MAG: hypothetical protein H6751_06110 [Candidatus Omnitrophica bacterium]|nr:hypothetical protein [Candidatus Omnitrophota bacterium]